jgi:multidrug resistance efflux pump
MAEAGAPKPKTTFDREYIVARIEARINSLKREIEVASAATKTLLKKQAQGDEEFLRTLHRELDKMNDEVVRFLEGVRKADPQEVVEKASAMMPRLNNLYYNSRKGLSHDERQELATLNAAQSGYEREINLLHHGYAYLKESPVEEYTVTSLSRLGLLDIVKFVLTTEAADRRDKSRRRR